MVLLREDEIEEKLLYLNEWDFEDNDVFQLVKEFKFNSFGEGVDFINTVREICDKYSHYPDILLTEYGVEILLHTPSEEGITQLDFDVALEIDCIKT